MSGPQSARDKEARLAIIDACLEMNASGLNQGISGNISVRHGDGILITPTSLAYDRMTPNDICWIGFDGSVEGPRRPSSEWRFHLDILRARPEFAAVVHAHPAACTTLSTMRKGIPALHYMIVLAGGNDICCSDYATFGSPELSRAALEAMTDRKACLLANHGMIAAEHSLERAMWLAHEVETLARLYLGCLQAGEPVLLTDAEIEVTFAQMRKYAYSR